MAPGDRIGLGVHADVGESGASSTQEISVQGVRRELRAVLVTDSLGHALYSRPPPYRDTG
nr:hypothetical protein [Rubripirellula obstinata]